MTIRSLTTLLAVGVTATALALAGCGGTSDATTDTTATATAATTTTPGTTSTAAATMITCEGDEASCTAKVPLGGGASNRAVAIALPGTDWTDPGADVDAEYEGSYEISGAQFTTGGSVYEFTLNAVESIPDGTDLALTFTQKG